MSRGLGKLQREILAVMEFAGGGSEEYSCRSLCLELGADVHDLQIVLWHLAVRCEQT